jgi:putative ABC transport system substrate-binding protein
MRRRDFITLLGGAAATWPLASSAQQSAMPVIGLLDQRSPDELADRLRGFRQGLRDSGFVEGQNVVIEYRWAENKLDRLPDLAADLIHRQVTVIAATSGVSPTLAAKAATTTIPVVFVVGDDPVKLGLVANLARPAGNLTGINFFSGELGAKRLELLREMVPKATRVAVLISPANTNYAEATLNEVGTSAHSMGLQIQVLKASTIPEINAAFATFAAARPDALFVGSRSLLQQPAHSIGPTRGALCGPGVIKRARFCGSRRAYELRSQHRGCMAPGWLLRWQHPQGRQARGLAGCAVQQARVGYQQSDRHNAQPDRPAVATRYRRRGDRMRGASS